MTDSNAQASPNCRFIGVSDARDQLSTPALLLDLNAFESNLKNMADYARQAGIRLRPHGKCHKSSAIARRQIHDGAVGICCANVGEAEVFFRGGVENLLLTSPMVTQVKLERVFGLIASGAKLMLTVDHPEIVQALDQLAQDRGVSVPVLVDLDCGQGRTGAASPAAAVDLIRRVLDSRSLHYRGMQCYAGHIQHIAEMANRGRAVEKAMHVLRETLNRLEQNGIESEIVSGGGTGTYSLDCDLGLFTELQVGSYVFMDAQYNEVWAGNGKPFQTSLFVQMAVSSCSHKGFATVDAGLKHFAFDGGVPVIVSGVPEGAVYEYTGDEHGKVILPEHIGTVSLGTRIDAITPHCDPTVNLYDWYHCVRDGNLEDIWPIDARGAF